MVLLLLLILMHRLVINLMTHLNVAIKQALLLKRTLAQLSVVCQVLKKEDLSSLTNRQIILKFF